MVEYEPLSPVELGVVARDLGEELRSAEVGGPTRVYVPVVRNHSGRKIDDERLKTDVEQALRGIGAGVEVVDRAELANLALFGHLFPHPNDTNMFLLLVSAVDVATFAPIAEVTCVLTCMHSARARNAPGREEEH